MVRVRIAAGHPLRPRHFNFMPHGFLGNVGQLEAAAEALKAIGTFLSARLVATAVHAT
jgi:hypothetical protein